MAENNGDLERLHHEQSQESAEFDHQSDEWQGENPPIDSFGDHEADAESLEEGASIETEDFPDEDQDDEPSKRGAKFLPVAATIAGVLLVGTMGYIQFGSSLMATLSGGSNAMPLPISSAGLLANVPQTDSSKLMSSANVSLEANSPANVGKAEPSLTSEPLTTTSSLPTTPSVPEQKQENPVPPAGATPVITTDVSGTTSSLPLPVVTGDPATPPLPTVPDVTANAKPVNVADNAAPAPAPAAAVVPAPAPMPAPLSAVLPAAANDVATKGDVSAVSPEKTPEKTAEKPAEKIAEKPADKKLADKKTKESAKNQPEVVSAPVAAAAAIIAPTPAANSVAAPVAVPDLAAQAKVDALIARVDSLQKALDQANQKLTQVSGKVDAAPAPTPVTAAPAMSPEVAERLNKLEHQLAEATRAAHKTQAVASPVVAAAPASASGTLVAPTIPSVAKDDAAVVSMAPTEEVKKAVSVSKEKPVKATEAKSKAAKVARAEKKKLHHEKKAHDVQEAKLQPKKSGWVLRAATADAAWVAKSDDSAELHQVEVGQTLAGLGTVQAIRQNGDSWQIVGSKGVLQ